MARWNNRSIAAVASPNATLPCNANGPADIPTGTSTQTPEFATQTAGQSTDGSIPLADLVTPSTDTTFSASDVDGDEEMDVDVETEQPATRVPASSPEPARTNGHPTSVLALANDILSRRPGESVDRAAALLVAVTDRAPDTADATTAALASLATGEGIFSRLDRIFQQFRFGSLNIPQQAAEASLPRLGLDHAASEQNKQGAPPAQINPHSILSQPQAGERSAEPVHDSRSQLEMVRRLQGENKALKSENKDLREESDTIREFLTAMIPRIQEFEAASFADRAT